MSYVSADMIANSDRGYEINLDNILYKKQYEKKFIDEGIVKILESEYEDLLDDAIGFGESR